MSVLLAPLYRGIDNHLAAGQRSAQEPRRVGLDQPVSIGLPSELSRRQDVPKVVNLCGLPDGRNLYLGSLSVFGRGCLPPWWRASSRRRHIHVRQAEACDPDIASGDRVHRLVCDNTSVQLRSGRHPEPGPVSKKVIEVKHQYVLPGDVLAAGGRWRRLWR